MFEASTGLEGATNTHANRLATIANIIIATFCHIDKRFGIVARKGCFYFGILFFVSNFWERRFKKMSMHDIYERINLQALTIYIASGRVVVDAADPRSYDDRLIETQENIDNSIELLIQGKQMLLKESIEQYGDLKFEIGFKAGLTLAMELITNRNF